MRTLTDFTPRNVCFMSEGDTFTPDPPASGEAPAAPDAEPEVELLFEEDAPADAPADDDSDELEIGATKHKVPKAVKEAWNGIQKTTQAEREAIAAEKRANEDMAKRYQENMRVASSYMKEIGEIQHIDKQLQDYEKLTTADWMAWAEQDQAAASKAQIGLNALRAEKDRLIRSVNDKEGSIRAQQQREQQEAAERFEREVATRVKDWSPAKRESLVKLGTEFGVQPAHVQSLMMQFPGVASALDELATYRAARARAQKVAAEAKANAGTQGKPEPVTRSRGNSGSSTSLSDAVGMDNWAERFKAQRAIHAKNRLR